MAEAQHTPARALSVPDAIFIVVGIVIGAGIFKAPALVAANTGNGTVLLLTWVAGGALALIGALCYAELASTYPSTGGDYHFLHRAFGPAASFLFAWSRLTVMQTGSIALLAYVFGDYATQIVPLGPGSNTLYAAAAVVLFTAINCLGIREGKGTQRVFTLLQLAGVLFIVVLGLAAGAHTLFDPVANSAAGSIEPLAGAGNGSSALGLAMVFVLLTYGGWNEAAYVSAEVRGSRTAIVRALLISIVLITALYVLINAAYLKALGHPAMAVSEAVAADAVRMLLGNRGAMLLSLIVAVSALTSINATIITGARCNHALGRDFRQFRFLGRWNATAGTPVNALLVQGLVALLLVALGAATRSGFATLVEYTAPVFWSFFLLTGLALMRLRRIDPHTSRPFRVPLYPLTPLLFCASSACMLWSSVNYTGIGALVGVAVLLAGLPILWIVCRQRSV